MTNLMTRLRTAAQKRAAYHRTVTEIRSMPLDVALDLGIYKAEARQIAHRSVYGA